MKIKLQRRHLLLALLVIATICALAGTLFYAYASTEQSIAHMASERSAYTKTMDTKIASIKKAKEQEKLRAQEEARRQAEDAAKAAAAAAATTDAARLATVSAPASCGTAPSSLSVVINKKHCFSPLSWAPADLASVNGYLMRQEAATQMIAMMQAAETAGNPFGLTSTYRSYENQKVTYNHWVAVNGSAAVADTVSARPGYSEHQTGLAADLDADSCSLSCFGGTQQYQWLRANAADYGFIERYPAGQSGVTGYSPEPWHWRYVTPGVSRDMKAKGILTLEQYFGVSGGGY